MNSGAPDATAPGERSSGGTMKSASFSSVLYSCGFSALGRYGPAVFSCAATLWTCCAASSVSPPDVAASAMFSSSVRRLISDIALPHFFRQILGCSPGHGDDGQGRILIRIADERRGVGDEQIFHFVRLAIFVEHRFRWIVAHTHCAEFVDDFAAGGDALSRHEIRARARDFSA